MPHELLCPKCKARMGITGGGIFGPRRGECEKCRFTQRVRVVRMVPSGKYRGEPLEGRRCDT
jgi:hypothetical protein